MNTDKTEKSGYLSYPCHPCYPWSNSGDRIRWALIAQWHLNTDDGRANIGNLLVVARA